MGNISLCDKIAVENLQCNAASVLAACYRRFSILF